MSLERDDGLPEEPEERVRHDAWVIPYADLMTLLMAMFIALFAMSTVDVTKFKAFAIGFNDALGGRKLDAGVGGAANPTATQVARGAGLRPLDGPILIPQNPVANESQTQQILSAIASNKAQAARQRQALDDVQRKIDDAAKRLGLGGQVRTKQLKNGLQVTLLTDQVLFQSGRADLQSEGVRLLAVVGNVLNTIDNTIQINGFTDNVPIAPGGRFPSNLYLSSFRADAVADFFASIGMDRARMFPAGRGDQDFIATNATAVGRALNRRVEIIVESSLVKRTLEQAGLDATPATSATLPFAPGKGSSGSPSVVQPNIKPHLAGN